MEKIRNVKIEFYENQKGAYVYSYKDSPTTSKKNAGKVYQRERVKVDLPPFLCTKCQKSEE